MQPLIIKIHRQDGTIQETQATLQIGEGGLTQRFYLHDAVVLRGGESIEVPGWHVCHPTFDVGVDYLPGKNYEPPKGVVLKGDGQ